MPTDTNVPQVVINQMTEVQLANATIQPNQIYVTPDEESDDAKANVDASNLSSANVTSWKTKLGTNIEDLWTNANPSNSFSAQDVALSKSIENFDFIVVQFSFSQNDVSDKVSAFGVAQLNQRICAAYTDDSWLGRMGKITANTTIHFNNAYNSGTSQNTRLIPYKVIGVKL